MEFSDIQGLIEDALSARVISSAKVSFVNVHFPFPVMFVVAISKGTHLDSLYIKVGPHVHREIEKNNVLRELGIAVPDEYRPAMLNAVDIDSMPVDIVFLRPVEGVSLHEVIRNRPDQAVRRCAEAFVAFHSRAIDSGLIHGDLHPGNIIFNSMHYSGTPQFIFLDCGSSSVGSAIEEGERLLGHVSNGLSPAPTLQDFWGSVQGFVTTPDMPDALRRLVSLRVEQIREVHQSKQAFIERSFLSVNQGQ